MTVRMDDEDQQRLWVSEMGCAYSTDGRHIVLGRACLSSDGASRIAIGGGWGASIWVADLAARVAAFRAEDDGEIEIRELPGGQELARFVTRGYNAVVAQDPAGLNLAVGDNAGRIYLLALEGINSQIPFVTATRLFRIATRQWDRDISARCSWCGNRFTPSRQLLDKVRSLFVELGLSSGQSPCLQLPHEAWEKEFLRSACTGCGRPVRFNPFVVDNGDMMERH